MQELISVITPVYNVEKYLCRCVDSIINQTYKNLEIILVDDGSTDNSGKICDEYAVKDLRIKVIHKENGGAAASRNCGLDVAKGKYIAFVDSDDYVEERFVESLHTLITDSNADIAQCSYCETYSDSANFLTSGTDVCIKSCQEMIDDLYCDGERHIATAVLWTKIYKREIFDELRLPEGIMYEDEAIMPQILYSADRIAVSENDKLYAYFMSENSVMRTAFSEKKLDYITALEHRIKFYKKTGMERFINQDVMKLMLKCLVFSQQTDDKKLKKKLVKKSHGYYKYVIRTKMTLKSKIKFTLYRIHPVFLKLTEKRDAKKR